MYRKLEIRSIVAFVAVTAAALAMASSSHAAQVYLEEFTNDTGTGGGNDQNMSSVGWSALLTDGGVITSYIQTGSGIATGVANGDYGFYAPQVDNTVANEPALLSTTEPGSINIAALDSITWDANADNADDEYRVAIQVGGVWYASNLGQSDGQTDPEASGPFVGLSYSPASFATASNWLVIENAVAGDSDPLSLGAAPGANLSGNVTAF
ncbi:MAG: hypothetical protein MI757_02190, partial [Pirellulales bacterium]|nr:hypothetical protein [Pirellulales bacterium]